MSEIAVPSWIKRLAESFKEKGHQFYIVGGAVRDQLLSRELTEWDATTDAKPTEIQTLLKTFKATQIGTLGAKFGTVTAKFHNEPIEITTYRKERYQPDSRQPDVSFGSSLQDDLSRRDFTINAIAYNPLSDQIIDPFHGQTDLERHLIRTVGQERDRFHEDPLRMLRAIRLALQLRFVIDPATLRAIERERERFAILSAERIAQELNKILLTDEPSVGVKLLVESGLISYILPELIPSIDLEFEPGEHKDIYHHILQVLDQTPPKLELRWCALLHDIAKPLTRKKIGGEYHFLGHEVVGARLAKTILRRLKYPNDFVDYVSRLVYLHQRIPNDQGNWTDGAVRRFVRDPGCAHDYLFTF